MFAGSWYPDNAKACEKQINTFLEEGQKSRLPTDRKCMGGIAPHAGWHFSGSIACNVIHSLTYGLMPDVIAIFGMHLHPNSNRFITKSGAFETPFGDLPIAEDLSRQLCQKFKFNVETTEKFNPDNTIELQLPFIKYFFPQVQIIPAGVPPHVSSLEVGQALAALADEAGINLKVIGSTDLTHYGADYGFTKKGTGYSAVKWVTEENDRRIIERIIDMDAKGVIEDGLTHQNACCAGAAAAAITAAQKLGARTAKSVAYATSYDKSPSDSFVGYVGVAFSEL
jgi:AmmeMemoRadiSam system protein B